MSDIEVTKLVLETVPILIEVINDYRNEINKLKSGFKKQKVIKKLERTLRYQKNIIETIT